MGNSGRKQQGSLKPLAHWAIHHQQRIRIAGRDRTVVWGALADPDGGVRSFHYDQHTLRLTIGAGDNLRILQLDEYGFEQIVER